MAERSGLKTVLGACKFCAVYLLKSAVQNSGEHVSAACSARKTYENGEAKENVDNKGTPVSGEYKEGTGNGSESRQRKAGATIENPAQFLKTGSFED